MGQKYKKGDRIRIVLVGHPLWEGDKIYDMNPELVGQLATVEFSYLEKYGGNIEQKPSYSLLFDNKGSIAWFHEYQMEPEITDNPILERIESASNSEFGKDMNKILEDVLKKILWKKSNY